MCGSTFTRLYWICAVYCTQFEQENEQLFEEMSSLVDEVRQIEGKVLEISRLQEVFTDRVLSQVELGLLYSV